MYRALRREAEQPAAEASAPPSRAEPAAPKRRALTYAERLELEGIFDRIAAAEEEVAALEARLADPSVYAGGGGADLVASHERARAALATLMARWEELEAKKAAAG
ncbi:MAG: hypothetical protein M5U28_24010 [Sandaracinaceae bacterium]|nr:hypothetical protein [Sandaracinaceae bacterium]